MTDADLNRDTVTWKVFLADVRTALCACGCEEGLPLFLRLAGEDGDGFSSMSIRDLVETLGAEKAVAWVGSLVEHGVIKLEGDVLRATKTGKKLGKYALEIENIENF